MSYPVGNMAQHDAALKKQADRLATLNEAVGKLIEQTTAKRALVEARHPTRTARERLRHRLGAVIKFHGNFHRRTGRAITFEGRLYADPAVALRLRKLAIRHGERVKQELERYDADLDELLTAL